MKKSGAIKKSGTDDQRVYLYDSTLRDGAQSYGVSFSLADKKAIARDFDRLGLDYIEGGWPGANPTDDAFFADPPSLSRARLVAFGMTRRPGLRADQDPGLQAVVTSKAPAVCLVGKTWDFHVRLALGVRLEENLAIIGESMAEAARHVEDVLFDAEHFFDGFKANPDYALKCLDTAYQAGARWVVLCDTNGGTLPHEIEDATRAVLDHIPGPHLGIHTHNDTDNATANSLAAVRAGARQIQGTFNGLGERCGNANLVSIMPSLTVKMGYKTQVGTAGLAALTSVSRTLDERLNCASDQRAPYVGRSAFAHKGGLHVSAIAKDPRSYEHIAPDLVGNSRQVVVSDQAGRTNIKARLDELGLKGNETQIDSLVRRIKSLEFEGYAYDGAGASFELLARRYIEGLENFYRLIRFRVTDARGCANPDHDGTGDDTTSSEATITVDVAGRQFTHTCTGNGPVNALDRALRQALVPAYPGLNDMELVDYKVRILTPDAGTRAVTRVMIESRGGDNAGPQWTTVGVSPNVINASYIALDDSINYRLYKELGAAPSSQR